MYFDLQTAAEAPVCRLKYTTILKLMLLNYLEVWLTLRLASVSLETARPSAFCISTDRNSLKPFLSSLQHKNPADDNAVFCNAMRFLQCNAVFCNAMRFLQCNAVFCNAMRFLQCNAVFCNAMRFLQCNAVFCNAMRFLQCNAVFCNAMRFLQCNAVFCNAMRFLHAF
jgi:hypothetical protein